MRIVPVIVIDDADRRRGRSPTRCAEGGIGCAEITLRTDAGLPAIAAVRRGTGFIVGAGTVLTARRSRPRRRRRRAVRGEPGSRRRRRRRAHSSSGVAVLPGSRDRHRGAACACGPACSRSSSSRPTGSAASTTIRALAGPFPGDRASSRAAGSPRANAGDYLATRRCPRSAAAGWRPATCIAAGDFEAIERLSRDAIALVEAASRDDRGRRDARRDHGTVPRRTTIGSLAHVSELRSASAAPRATSRSASRGSAPRHLARPGRRRRARRRVIMRELRAEGVETAARVDPAPHRPHDQGDADRRTHARAVLPHGERGQPALPRRPRRRAIASAAMLHVTGITPALSAAAARRASTAVDRATEAGVPVSFDVNHRARSAGPRRAASLPPIAGAPTIVFAGSTRPRCSPAARAAPEPRRARSPTRTQPGRSSSSAPTDASP